MAVRPAPYRVRAVFKGDNLRPVITYFQSFASASADYGAKLADLDTYPLNTVELMLEHRDLDAAITQLGTQSSAPAMLDQLALKRMKKRKLLLKDQIAQLERQLDPDIRA
jgi:hypothetical protein